MSKRPSPEETGEQLVPHLNYDTLLPVLADTVSRTTGPVLELGAGAGSTPLLHAMLANRRPLVTFETNEAWHKKVSAFTGYRHEIHLIPETDDGWESIYNHPLVSSEYFGVVLIDHLPVARRKVDIARLQFQCEFMVICDTNLSIYEYEDILLNFKYRCDIVWQRPWVTVASQVRRYSCFPQWPYEQQTDRADSGSG